jgi:hypothetical protein
MSAKYRIEPCVLSNELLYQQDGGEPIVYAVMDQNNGLWYIGLTEYEAAEWLQVNISGLPHEVPDDEPSGPFDYVGFITKFEQEDMDIEEVAEGFQHLIDDGIIGSLQGSYQRTARALAEEGWVTL